MLHGNNAMATRWRHGCYTIATWLLHGRYMVATQLRHDCDTVVSICFLNFAGYKHTVGGNLKSKSDSLSVGGNLDGWDPNAEIPVTSPGFDASWRQVSPPATAGQQQATSQPPAASSRSAAGSRKQVHGARRLVAAGSPCPRQSECANRCVL